MFLREKIEIFSLIKNYLIMIILNPSKKKKFIKDFLQTNWKGLVMDC
jgi:hypothetical protein